MEPFHVICETCHARLKIRSAAVIGEIHACPRCESMVQIVPPADWVAASKSTVGSGGETDRVAAAASDASAARATPPTWTWALAGAGVVLVAGVAAIWVWSNSGGADAPVARSAVAADTPPVEPAAPVVAVAEPVETAIEEAAADGPLANDSHDLMSEPVEPSIETADVVAAVEAEDGPGDVVEALDNLASELETAAAEPASHDAPAATTNKPKPVMRFDPLDFDPAELSLGAALGAPSAKPESSVAASDAPEIRTVAAASDEASTPVEAEPLAARVTVRLGPPPTAGPSAQDVAAQLGAEIESLDLAEVPLVRLLDLVSQLTDVPIALDPTALTLAGASPRTTVNVAARQATLEQVLRDALATPRLDFEVRDGQIVVVRPNAEARRTVSYDVADLLAAGATDAGDVAKLVTRFVAPESWSREAAGGTIEVDGTQLRVAQPGRVQIEVLLFCERLRLARGLPARSRYPAERLSLESPYKRLSSRLGRTTTFTFLPWTQLSDVVRHWEESSGVTMLVDWPELAKGELARQTPIACSAIQQRWDEALDAVLEPLGLAWWAVDGETIQITSREAVSRMAQVEFYAPPVSLRDSSSNQKALLAALASELRDAADAGGEPATVPTLVELDEVSGKLIVLGPPTTHRRLSGQVQFAAERQALSVGD